MVGISSSNVDAIKQNNENETNKLVHKYFVIILIGIMIYS